MKRHALGPFVRPVSWETGRTYNPRRPAASYAPSAGRRDRQTPSCAHPLKEAAVAQTQTFTITLHAEGEVTHPNPQPEADESPDTEETNTDG